VLLIITTRYIRVAVELFRLANTPSSSFITCGVNVQLKRAMVLRDGHSNGCSASESKTPTAQEWVLVTTRVSKAGIRFNRKSKNARARDHGSLFTWNSRTEVVGKRRSSGSRVVKRRVRKENEPLLPDMWSSLGEFWTFTMVNGVNAPWICRGLRGRDDCKRLGRSSPVYRTSR